MLQPLQLREVSVRYEREIAELRDFLLKADHPALDTTETLSGMTARLREDRGYRRDLISHVWVVIHQCGEEVSYSDLLGMLAIAAAGPRFAAAADEIDAHDLLRFLMEARRSFGTRLEPTEQKIVRPVRMTPKLAHLPSFMPVESIEEDEVNENRGPVFWITAAVCLLVAILAGTWWHYRLIAEHEVGAVLATRTTEVTAVPNVSEDRSSARLVPRSSGAGTISVKPSVVAPKSAQVANAAAKIVPSEPAETNFTASRSLASADGAVARTSTAAPASPEKRLVSPVAPKPSSAGNYAAEDAPPPFKLLRRNPPSAPTGNPNLVGESRPSDLSSTDGSGSRSPSNPVHGGTVHPTSLGAMAGNVMYSPAPAYPAEASAEHVQGEVKLEAEVDRDGNVTGARVISGPPLLREAATDALEHWRYRPYLYDGKPISMNALVVMDFKLP